MFYTHPGLLLKDDSDHFKIKVWTRYLFIPSEPFSNGMWKCYQPSILSARSQDNFLYTHLMKVLNKSGSKLLNKGHWKDGSYWFSFQKARVTSDT